MTCRETEQLVTPYINGELTEEELTDFLEHIGMCESCREELEIYFTVDVGIRQLDSGTGSYNIKGALERSLLNTRMRVKNFRVRQIIRYAVNTLSIVSLLVMLLLQCRIWLQWGIF